MPTIDTMNVTTSANGVDLIIVGTDPAGVPNTFSISITSFFANVQPIAKFNQLQLANTASPANGTVLTIQGGEIFFDASYLYIATANNVVKRLTLEAF